MKAVLYARVSTKDQAEEGYSLSAQTRLLKDYAERKGLEITKEFAIPESASGRVERKTFAEMLDHLRINTEVKYILCEKVDRITRNFKDAVKLDEWLNEDEERQVHFVKQSLIIHKNAKSNEKFQWDIYLALARQYSNNLSEEVKKGQKEKIAAGWLPAKPPLGYRTVGDKGHKVHVIDDSTAPLVKRMFELYATGNYSTKKLGQVMYQEGLRTRDGNRLVKSRLHDLLSDPFYYGMLRWNEEVSQGKHQPLISRELFDTVQDNLNNKGTHKHRKYLPLFKGFIKCGECGGTVTWEIQKGHWYGHCNHYRSCTQKKYVRQEMVEERVLDYLNALTIEDGRIVEWIKKSLKESHKDEIEYHKSSLGELNHRYEQIQRRLDLLYDDKLDGRITKEFYERKFKQYTEEKEVAVESIRQHDTSQTKYFELGMNILELAQRAKEIYLKRSVEEKRQLLSLVFSNLSLKDGNASSVYHPAFQLIAERVKTSQLLRR